MATKISTLIPNIVEPMKRVQNLKLVGFDEQSRAGYTLIPKYLFDLDISIQAKLIYACFLDYAWNDDFCFPGQEILSEKLRISGKPLRNYIKELEKAGLIKKKKRGQGKTNIYVLYCKPIKSIKK